MKFFLRTVFGLFICLMATAGFLAHAAAGMGTEHPLIGKAAPDFSLQTVQSEANVKFSDYRQGHKAIIFFWATWCPHCRSQIQALTQKKAEIDGAGIQVALVNIGESADTVKKFLAAKQYNEDVFLDVDGDVSGNYGVFGIPTLFFVGEDGVIRDMEYGFPDDYLEILK